MHALHVELCIAPTDQLLCKMNELGIRGTAALTQLLEQGLQSRTVSRTERIAPTFAGRRRIAGVAISEL